MTRNPIPVRPDFSTVRARPRDALHRALTARFLAAVRKELVDDVLVRNFSGDKATGLIVRSSVDPASTGGSGWADTVAGSAVADMIVGLAGPSACAALISAGLSVGLEGVKQITVPGKVVTANDVGGFLAELQPIPVLQYDVSSGPTITPFKISNINVVANELAEYAVSDVQAILTQISNEAWAATLDAKLFSADAAVSGVSPPGILADVTPLSATTGGSVTAMAADIKKLVNALAAQGAGIAPVFVCDPGSAATIKTLAGNKFDYPVLPTSALTNSIIAVEASSFVSGFNPVPRIDIAQHATLHMSTTPAPLSTEGTPNTVAAPTRNLFQTNCSAIRTTLRCGWGLRNSGHVQTITDMTW